MQLAQAHQGTASHFINEVSIKDAHGVCKPAASGRSEDAASQRKSGACINEKKQFFSLMRIIITEKFAEAVKFGRIKDK